MKKHAWLIAITVLGLSACQPSTSEVSADFRIPKGLYDCQFYSMNPGGLSHDVLVVRCPHSDTSTQETQNCGKGCTRNVQSALIEGNEIRDSPYAEN